MKSSMDCWNVMDDASGFYTKGTNVSTKKKSNTYESSNRKTENLSSLFEKADLSDSYVDSFCLISK